MGERTLGRIAGDLFAYVLAFQTAPESARPPAAALRQQLLGLLEAFRNDPDAQAAPAGDLEQARFALVAWTDEMLLRTVWAGRDEWEREPLQLALFRTNKAGDEFYEHLAQLRAEQRDAREVYFYCLALGFEGQYLGHGAERRALLQQQYEMLRREGRALDVATAEPLAPAAYDTAITLEDRSGRRVWPWLAACTVGALVVFGALWLVLRFVADRVPGPLGI